MIKSKMTRVFRVALEHKQMENLPNEFYDVRVFL